jgi:hypothetical protein
MKRKKENVPNQNSLGSASRRESTERRKTKKNILVIKKPIVIKALITIGCAIFN